MSHCDYFKPGKMDIETNKGTESTGTRRTWKGCHT